MWSQDRSPGVQGPPRSYNYTCCSCYLLPKHAGAARAAHMARYCPPKMGSTATLQVLALVASLLGELAGWHAAGVGTPLLNPAAEECLAHSHHCRSGHRHCQLSHYLYLFATELCATALAVHWPLPAHPCCLAAGCAAAGRDLLALVGHNVLYTLSNCVAHCRVTEAHLVHLPPRWLRAPPF